MIEHHNFFKLHLPNREYKEESKEDLQEMLMEEFYLYSDGNMTPNFESNNKNGDPLAIILYPSFIYACHKLKKTEKETGRNTINVLQTLQYFYDKGVVVKIDNLGLESMINGKANPVFNLITTILSELSSLEKTSLFEHQKEGILVARLRNPFLYKGRISDTTDSPEETLAKHKKTIKALKTNPNLSLRQIAKLASDVDYKVSANTVKKVKELMNV